MKQYILALCMISLSAVIRIDGMTIDNPVLEQKLREYPHNTIGIGIPLWFEVIKALGMTISSHREHKVWSSLYLDGDYKQFLIDKSEILDLTPIEPRIRIDMTKALTGEIIGSGELNDQQAIKIATRYIGGHTLIHDRHLYNTIGPLMGMKLRHPCLITTDQGVDEEGRQIIELQLISPQYSNHFTIAVANADGSWNLGMVSMVNLSRPLNFNNLQTDLLPAIRHTSGNPALGGKEIWSNICSWALPEHMYHYQMAKIHQQTRDAPIPEPNEYRAAKLYLMRNTINRGFGLCLLRPMHKVRFSERITTPWKITIMDPIYMLGWRTNAQSMEIADSIVEFMTDWQYRDSPNEKQVITDVDVASSCAEIFPADSKITLVEDQGDRIAIMVNDVAYATIERSDPQITLKWKNAAIVGMPIGIFLKDFLMEPHKYIEEVSE